MREAIDSYILLRCSYADRCVCNQNDYDLQVTGVDVRLELNGKRLARGLGNKEFTVPPLSESVVSLETSTSMLDIVRQVLGLRTLMKWRTASAACCI